MRAFLDTLYKASGWAAAFFIVAICGVVLIQVFLNLIDKIAMAVSGEAIGLTLPSYADFTGFFLAAASFLALAYTLRQGGHIRVSLVTAHLPAPLQYMCEIACLGLASTISLYFTYYTAKLVHESWTFNDLSSGIVAVPIWIPQSSMSLGLVILSVALLDELVALLRGKTPSYHGKGENLLAPNDPATHNQETS